MRKFAILIISIFAAFPAFSNARLPVVNVGSAAVSARAAFGEEIEISQRPKKKSETKSVVARVPSIADVLMPNRPSPDLWAKIEKPLRLPEPAEIAVIRDETPLAEENLDTQINKLVELQKAADESVKIVSRSSSIVSAPAPEVKLSRVVVPMDTNHESRITNHDDEVVMSSMSPSELKKAFKKTYLSENKHLSAYQIDDRFDVASDAVTNIEGFTSARDLSESGGVRPLEIKIGFRDDDAALSRDNYNLLSEYASIVVSNPKRAIQVSIPERATRSLDGRKLAARRLAIIEQVLHDTGVSDSRVMPVLASRNDESFVLRVISSDQFETLTQQKRDMFGDATAKKTYKSMSW